MGDALITRRGGAGGIEIPNNYKEIEAYSNLPNEALEKGRMGIVQGRYNSSTQKYSLYPDKNNDYKLKTQTVLSEEYSGIVYAVDYKHEKNKGIMIKNSGNMSTLNASIFTYEFDQNSVVDEQQFQVSILNTAFITSSAKGYVDYGRNVIELYLVEETDEVSKYIVPFISDISYSKYYGICFLTVNWTTNEIIVKLNIDVFSFNGSGISIGNDFYFYKVFEDNKLVFVYRPDNANVKHVTDFDSTAVTIKYGILSFNFDAGTVSIIKRNQTLMEGRARKQGFGFTQIGKKFIMFCNNDTTATTELIFYSLSDDGSFVKGKEIQANVGNSDYYKAQTAFTIDYDNQQKTAVIGLSAFYDLNTCDLTAFYKIDVENETAVPIQSGLSAFITNTGYQYFEKVKDFTFFGVPGKLEIAAIVGSSSYAYFSFHIPTLSGQNFDWVASKRIRTSPGSTSRNYLSDVIVQDYKDDNFILSLSVNGGEVTYLVANVHRLGIRLEYPAINTASGSTYSYPNPTIVTEKMSKWKKGKMIIPKDWLT